MHGRVARQTFETSCHVYEIADVLLRIVAGFEFRIHLQRFIERDIKFPRNHLGDRVRLSIGQIKNTRDVANDAAGCHGAERDDLHNTVTAVLAHDVVDDLLASLEAEIHINIGHGDSLGIQESLKEQIVAERIEVGDAQRVGHDRTCRRASSRTYRNPVIPRKFNIVPHNKEIIHEPHVPDRLQFVGQSVFDLFRDRMIALLDTLMAQLVQIGPGIIAVRNVEFRELSLAEGDRDIASLRDFLCVSDCLRHKAEQRGHLLGRLYIILAALVAHAVLVHDLLSCLDAEKNVVGINVLFVGVVAVICTDEREALLVMHTDKLPVHMLLFGNAVVLKFKEEIVLTENIPVLICRPPRAFIIAAGDGFRNLSREAGGQADDALVVFSKYLLVHAGLIIIAVCKAGGHNVCQVGIALIVLGQKDQMIVSVLARHIVPVKSAVRSHVDLAADDRTDPLGFALLIKINTAVHNTVVGDCTAVHAQLFYLGDILFNLVGSIKKRILRVDMKMCKRHCYLIPFSYA